VAVKNTPKTVAIFDTSGSALYKLPMPGGITLRGGAFARDGRTVALDFGAGYVRLCELASQTVRAEFGKVPRVERWRGQMGIGLMVGDAAFRDPLTIATAAFAPDGRTLAVVVDSRVQLLDVDSGKVLKTLSGHQGTIQAVVFAPDGKTLASAGADTTGLVWKITDVVKPPAPVELSDKQLADAWAELPRGDGVNAGEAVRLLTLGAAQSVPFLKKALRPAVAPDEKIVAQLIANLDSQEFNVRKQATAELEKLGELAFPALRRALQAQPPLEARRRLENLLARGKGRVLAGERLRNHRAIEVLERVGTPDAAQVLSALAQGAPEALITETAREALSRLKKR